MDNLSKVVSNNFNLLSKDLGLVNLDGLLDKGRKGGFLDLIFSEMKGVSKIRGSVLDFLGFLKRNGLIDNKLKKMSLDKIFAFEKKLSDSGFMSDLKSLVKKMGNLSGFENFRALGENLSGNRLINQKEIIKGIENFLSEINVLFGNMNSLLGFDIVRRS